MGIVGRDEVETPARLAAVVDDQGEARAASEGPAQLDAQALAIVVDTGHRLSVDTHLLDGHVHRVQLDLVQAVLARGQGKTRLTVQRARGQVWLKVRRTWLTATGRSGT